MRFVARQSCPIALFVWIFCNNVLAQTQIHNAKTTLKQAKQFFDQNECKKLVDLLGSKNLSRELEEENQFVESYYMLAVCYFRLGDTKKAEAELSNLLFLRPDFELDAFATPPPLLDMFKQLQTLTQAKSKELELAKEKAIEKPKVFEKETIYRRTSIIPAFIPFGVGQFENGDTTKGIMIAVSEATALSANIGFYWWKRSIASTGNASKSQYDLAQTLQFVAIGAFVALYIYGTIDAALNREPLIVESTVIKQSDKTTEEFLKELDRAKKE